MKRVRLVRFGVLIVDIIVSLAPTQPGRGADAADAMHNELRVA